MRSSAEGKPARRGVLGLSPTSSDDSGFTSSSKLDYTNGQRHAAGDDSNSWDGSSDGKSRSRSTSPEPQSCSTPKEPILLRPGTDGPLLVPRDEDVTTPVAPHPNIPQPTRLTDRFPQLDQSKLSVRDKIKHFSGIADGTVRPSEPAKPAPPPPVLTDVGSITTLKPMRPSLEHVKPESPVRSLLSDYHSERNSRCSSPAASSRFSESDSDFFPSKSSIAEAEFNILDVCLERDCEFDESFGLHLAASLDVDFPEIIVGRITRNSAAERDGRLCPGDRILAIEGQELSGYTAADARALLRTKNRKIYLTVEKKYRSPPLSRCLSASSTPRSHSRDHSFTDSGASVGDCDTTSPRTVTEVTIQKTRIGCGFSIQGGKDVGRPITVKRIFTGANASQVGLREGDELLSFNGLPCKSLSHIEAWNRLKALSEGDVVLQVARK